MSWEEVLDSFAREFVERRARREGFDYTRHSFYVHDPMTQFLSVLFTGFIGRTSYYYMRAEEVFALSLRLHALASMKDPDFYVDALRAARGLPAIKDQVMLGVLNLSKHAMRTKYRDDLVALLSSFPPSQIVKKYIDTKRKHSAIVGGGLGSFEKRVLRAVWESWADWKREYYAAKYRRYVKDMIRVAHIPVSSDLWSYLVKPTAYSGQSPYLSKVSRWLKTRSEDIAFDHPKLPFNLYRSNVPFSEWTTWALANTDLTGNTVVLQAKSLYMRFGDDFLPYLSRAARSPTVTADKILKAAIACFDIGPLARELARQYAVKAAETYKQVLLPVEMPNLAVVLDASGSMEPIKLQGPFGKALSVVAPLAPLVRRLIMFSEKARDEDPRLLSSFEGLERLLEIAMNDYNSSTNIADGLALALDAVKSREVNAVVLVTDEQANVLRGAVKEMDIMREIMDEGAAMIVVNPTPYPVHIADIRDKRIVYVPAPNPESFAAALRLVQVERYARERGAKALVEALAKAKPF